MLIPEISAMVYQVNATIIRNIHNHHHYLSYTWTGANFLWLDASVNLPLHQKVQKFSSGTGSPGWCGGGCLCCRSIS